MEKLEIPKNQWNEYLQAVTLIEIQIDPGIFNITFLGIPVPQQEGTYLSENILRELNTLKIKPQGQAYTSGLLSLVTESNNRYCLPELYEFLIRRLQDIKEDNEVNNWFQQLILAAKLIQLLLYENLYQQNRTINLGVLLKEQDRLYAQIACYCLPSTFLRSLKSPATFIEQLAPKVGRYLILKYQDINEVT